MGADFEGYIRLWDRELSRIGKNLQHLNTDWVQGAPIRRLEETLRACAILCHFTHSFLEQHRMSKLVAMCVYSPALSYFPVSPFQRILSISRNIRVPSRKGLMRVPSL